MNGLSSALIENTNGIESSCIKFDISETTNPFIFHQIVKKEQEYTFSAWVKAEGNFRLNIENQIIDINSEWEKIKVTFTASSNDFYIYFLDLGTYYFFETQLEEGSTMSSWTPAPEDIDASLELKVNSEDLISEINASANVIRLKSNRLVVESDNLQISEDGTLKTQRGEIGGFVLHENVLAAEADRFAEINIKYKTHADAEEREGYIQIGNNAENNDDNTGAAGIFVKDYDLYGNGIFTRIGNVLGGGILIETEEPHDALHISDKGIARVDGNAVCINGREYGVNKVLWSGASFMHDTQTITLSESISVQPTGVVLAFSWYENSTAYDIEWIYCFLPKLHVKNHGGRGVSFLGSASDGAAPMNKYLYVSDTSIKGYASNDNSFTASGISYQNGKYVLRYVIGV